MKRFEQIFQKVKLDLEQNLPSYLCYHNLEHTEYVLEKAIFIAEKENVSDTQELILLKIAAIYHDTGFLIKREDHEIISCEIAGRDLEIFGFAQDEIDQICEIILSTKLPQNPKTKLGKILADADLEYLGTNKFDYFGQKLYKELLHFQPELNNKKWIEKQIEFISNHFYHTDYCQKYTEPGKLKNLEKVKKEGLLLS